MTLQLAQDLFYPNGTVYNQTLILNDKFEVDPVLLQEQGLPFYAGTWVINLLSTNLGMAATFTHLLLWNFDDMKAAWSWASPSELRKAYRSFNWRFWQDDGMRYVDEDDLKQLDPHYREMLKYPDAPNSWYFVTLVLSVICALVVIYKSDSTMPWCVFLFTSMIVGITNIIYKVGILHLLSVCEYVYSLLRGPLCDYGIPIHHPNLYSNGRRIFATWKAYGEYVLRTLLEQSVSLRHL